MDLLTCCVVGTRPEAIKMAPVIMELHKECGVHPYVLATGQHAEMLRQSLSFSKYSRRRFGHHERQAKPGLHHSVSLIGGRGGA